MTGSGTGTPLTPSAGTTLADLRAAIRLQLPNATTWPDATLNSYIGDAIRFYSAEYPRLLHSEITVSTAGYTYTFASYDVLAVLSVSLNDNRLTRVAETELVTGAYTYAVRDPDEDTVVLVFPDALAEGDELALDYHTHHAIPSDDASVITVPQAHREALVAFVDFRGHWQLESTEAVDPDPETMTLAQLGDNSRRAWIRFKEIMARFSFNRLGSSAITTWDNSRIYSSMAKKRMDPWAQAQSWLTGNAEEEVSGLRSLTINGVVQFVSGGILRYGKKTHDSTATGFWLGVDPEDRKAKLHFGSANYAIYWTGDALRIKALHLMIDEDGIQLTAGDDAENSFRITSTDGTVNQAQLYAVTQPEEGTLAGLVATGLDADAPEAGVTLAATTYDGAAHAGLANVSMAMDTTYGQLSVVCTSFNFSTAYLQAQELAADPDAPAANFGRIYFRDDGAGKTQLCVRFSSGAIKVLETQD